MKDRVKLNIPDKYKNQHHAENKQNIRPFNMYIFS